ncbi:Uncharacterised protein [Actinobaculum suis]|uniref:Uncharacterized protein n=1 Tax=Actinobaculum suis TaxID=1657 RepID=A0A7Z8Y8F6_9ACTO|nr:hypothetical protein [Actinobaculum suis]VDG76182.1 Uncharacterised protein [Actinobaculum suis]
MARIRTIKPEFFSSPSVAKASPLARLTYIGMWTWADDSGVGTLNEKELEGYIFPNDDLAELTNAGGGSCGHVPPTSGGSCGHVPPTSGGSCGHVPPTSGGSCGHVPPTSGGSSEIFRRLVAEVADCFELEFYRSEKRPYYRLVNFDKHQRVERKSRARYPGPEAADDGEIFASYRDFLGESRKLQASSADERRNLRTSSAAGTGEQGNRGTGEQRYMHTAPQAAGAPDSQPGPSSLPAGNEPAQPGPEKEPGAELVQGQLPGTQTDRAREYSAEFEEFWAAYPVRKGKARAFEAFKKARKKVAQKTLVEAAARYADWVQARGIENPKWAQGWLNDERWADELDFATARPPSRAAQWLEAGYQLAAEQEAQARGPDPWEIPIGEIDLEGADPWASLPS